MKTDSMTIDNKELNNVEATKEQTGQTSDTWQAYTKKTHIIGRTVSIVTLVMLVGAPFLIGKILGAYPDLGAVGKGFLSVGIVWLVSSIAEFLIYTPMLGAGGGYLAFITGNLINMKIAALPLILMSLLFILVPSLIGSTSFMIVPSGAIAIGVAYLMFRKKNMQSPEQTKADPDRANTGDE